MTPDTMGHAQSYEGSSQRTLQDGRLRYYSDHGLDCEARQLATQ